MKLIPFPSLKLIPFPSLGGREIIPWRANFAAATQESRQSHKPVLLYLTASWCGPCQSLKSTLWADKDVEAALRDYVRVKVDVDQSADVAADYLRTPRNLDGGIPAFRVLDEQGRVTREAVGAVSAEQFLRWLKGK